MNFLAHAHLACLTSTSITGNILGDFVKGSVDILPYNEDVKHGIRLHRAIDSFTDHHSLTRELKSDLGDLRRFGGIIIDVLYDHQLANQFHLFHNDPLAKFSRQTYKTLFDEHNTIYPSRYHSAINSMSRHDWFLGYKEINNIENTLIGISSRLKRPVDLSASLTWYKTRNSQISELFPKFYQDLINFCRDFN